jgi:hypothetical protein
MSAYHFGVDLFYFPDSLAAGAERLRSPNDRGCPYNGLSAPQAKPGSIVILGHTDRSGARLRVTGYSVVGFDEETSRPMKDSGALVDRYVALYRHRVSDFIHLPRWPRSGSAGNNER